MDFLTIFGIIAVVVGAILTIFSRLPKETIRNQKDLIDAQEKRLKNLEDSDKEKTNQIAQLQSKVDVLATIPLSDIAKAIKDIAHAQREIIKLVREK